MAPHNQSSQLPEPAQKAPLNGMLVEKLVSLLVTPDKLNFPIAVCVLHDLIIQRVLKCDIFPEQARNSAISALKDSDIRRRAEELLSLIAFPDDGGNELQSAEMTALADDYHHRFVSSLKDPECNEPPELLFSVLCHLNAWETSESRWEALNQISRYYSENSKWVCNETTFRMERYIARYAPNPQFWPMHTTRVAPRRIGKAIVRGRTATDF